MDRQFDPAELELMDRPQPVSIELERDLRSIRQLNRWFGSHRVVRHFVRRWIRPGARMRIIDLATGSGDIPRLIVDLARKMGANVEIDALDRQSATLEIARGLSNGYPEISYVEKNILQLKSPHCYDIVLCSLVLHHFSEEDAVCVLRHCRELAQKFVLVSGRGDVMKLTSEGERTVMPLLKPDPTFYPSPRLAMQAPSEKYAFVAGLNPPGSKLNDALLVVDVDPDSRTYGRQVGEVTMPEFGDELHHFGWNACSSALCPYAPHPHVERRYLVVPGLRSSRIHIIDTKPNPRKPKIVKVIEPEEVFARANYSRPHTIHCGPEGIYVSALGAPNGDGPGGIFMLDCETFEILCQWEMDRGPQFLHYDFWWHLGFDTLLSSEWGTPNMIENGLQPDLLLASKYGHQIHVWDLRRRRHLQALDLGNEQQMVLEMRPAHDPTKAYGFVGVVVSLKDLSASIWLWHRNNGAWDLKKVIEIPAEPADPEKLPAMLI